jgi:hydroxymethylbilane synthase
LTKIPDGGAIVMAVAALEILGLTDRIAEALPVDEFVPAVGQGCVAVECRADDPDVLAAVAAIDDGGTRRAVEIERAFLAELGAGCSLPVGAHVAGGRLLTFLADLERGISVADDLALAGGGDPDVDLETARAAARSARTALA